jgi:hypothetical protein
MEDLGAVSDDQVILAWLQAEIESPPFQRLGLRVKERCRD